MQCLLACPLLFYSRLRCEATGPLPLPPPKKPSLRTVHCPLPTYQHTCPDSSGTNGDSSTSLCLPLPLATGHPSPFVFFSLPVALLPDRGQPLDACGERNGIAPKPVLYSFCFGWLRVILETHVARHIPVIPWRPHPNLTGFLSFAVPQCRAASPLDAARKMSPHPPRFVCYLLLNSLQMEQPARPVRTRQTFRSLLCPTRNSHPSLGTTDSRLAAARMQ